MKEMQIRGMTRVTVWALQIDPACGTVEGEPPLESFTDLEVSRNGLASGTLGAHREVTIKRIVREV